MATTTVSHQDRKELEKYTKYLVYKCIQVIVQSRLGERVVTQSRPLASGTDWFNLSIKDIPEILQESKKLYAKSRLNPDQRVCLEISLRTAEGESMILETWWLEMADSNDAVSRVLYTVYSRMGTLLKSLMCFTRATPAYKLARKQNVDSYVICYRIYSGAPQFHLGEAFRKQKVGVVVTPLGTICLCVAYRTKLTISPQQSMKDALEMRDNYYDVVTREKHLIRHISPQPCKRQQEDRNSLSEEGIDFQDRLMSAGVGSPVESGPDSFSANYSPGSSTRGYSPQLENIAEHQEKTGNKVRQVKPAFAPSLADALIAEPEDLPFQSLLQGRESTEKVIQPVSTQPQPTAVSGSSVVASGNASGNSSISRGSAPEDFVMVELKTPFGDDEEDLGKFYRECQSAPPLSMFQQQTDVQTMLNSITDQLAVFEANAKDINEFVNSLQEVDV